VCDRQTDGRTLYDGKDRAMQSVERVKLHIHHRCALRKRQLSTDSTWEAGTARLVKTVMLGEMSGQSTPRQITHREWLDNALELTNS